ncbi:MAG: HlyD family secretion protein [Anaerolineae bacterium]
MKRMALLIIVLGWGFTLPAAAAGPITGSGTIEAETIIIAAETGGRISDVLVDEGAEVQAGDLLVQLDDSLLIAQRAQLEAAIATAQANLATVKAGPRAEEIAAAEAELSQAQTQKGAAYRMWQQAAKLIENPQPLLIPIRQAEATVKQAEGGIEGAEIAVRTAEIQLDIASRDQSSHAALVGYQIAQKQLKATRVGQKLADAQLSAAKIQLAHLWERYTNPIPFQVQARQAESVYRLAEAAVAVARAKLDAVSAGPTPEAVAVAEAQVRQAQSALALFDAQHRKLALTAPRDGLIAIRVADPGELALPGATLLTLADLDRVTLTVFIPETQIGQVQVGQTARVTIDSVSQVFEGRVTFINHEAEFTPKNVQTKEERVNLVFAVEITLDNPDHILKPGMPADAEILP